MGRKKSPTSEMDVAEKLSAPLTQRLNELITDSNELKDFLGCSIQAVNQYKLGTSRPSLENLCKIADFYGVSTDYLLGRAYESTTRPDIKTTCATTGLEESAVDFLESLKNANTIECNYALKAINMILSAENDSVKFWKRIFVFIINSGNPFRAPMDGETEIQLFSSEEVLDMYLSQNNRYLWSLRDKWQQAHKKEESKSGKYQKGD